MIINGILFIFSGIIYLFGLLRMKLNKYFSKDNDQKSKEKFSFKCSEVSNIILNGTIGIVI